MDPLVLKLPRGFKALDYPARGFGRAKITHVDYEPGTYRMEGVDGYLFMKLDEPLKVTTLEIDDDTVMVDDPLQWFGMQTLADRSAGRVLVCGLGLGVVLHHLKRNEEVTRIDVYELHADVVRLIEPLLPPDDRRVMHIDNAFNAELEQYDTVILDILVTAGAGKGWLTRSGFTGLDVAVGFARRVEAVNPECHVFLWGLRGPKDNRQNPSVPTRAEAPGLWAGLDSLDRGSSREVE